jgi:glycosyltransferase domain-containing protein
MELLYSQDTQVKLLNQLTVIIFSRERHKELVKCLKYWENLGVRCIVLDNSSIALKNSSQNLDSTYFHCAGLNFAQRSLIASENISTKYSIICPDDERFLPESLASMISLLENENELNSVGANVIAISKYGPIITATSVYSQMRNYKNLGDNLNNRVETHFFPENSEWKIASMYRVIRSSTMRRLLELFFQLTKVSTPYIFEITSEIFLTIEGKVEYLDVIYWIRNWENPAINKPDWDRKLGFSFWWTEDSFRSEKNSWVHSIVNEFNAQLEKEELVDLINTIAVKRKNIEIYSEIKKPFLSDKYFKYALKRLFFAKSTPLKINQVLARLKNQGIDYNLAEVNFAVNSMLSK